MGQDIATIIDSTGGIPVLHVAGELDIATVPEFNQAASDAIAAASGSRLIVDLLGVTFIDSTGLGALVSVKRENPGLDVSLVIGGGIIRKTVAATGLDQWFTIAASVEEAGSGA